MTGNNCSDSLRSLIFPSRCIFCGGFIFRSDINTCSRCIDSLPYIRGKICEKCGREKRNCACTSAVLYYDKIAAPFYFTDGVRNCILNLKFHSKKKYASYLAEYMLDTMRERLSGDTFDFIAYVPLNIKDRRERGYNQSELLAEKISFLTGIPVKHNLIIKKYRTGRQSEKAGVRRSGNVMGAFDVSEDISGCSVLLIDDIKTTGATLSECGKMLYLSGAQSVTCLCAAVSEFRKNKG